MPMPSADVIDHAAAQVVTAVAGDIAGQPLFDPYSATVSRTANSRPLSLLQTIGTPGRAQSRRTPATGPLVPRQAREEA